MQRIGANHAHRFLVLLQMCIANANIEVNLGTEERRDGLRDPDMSVSTRILTIRITIRTVKADIASL